MHSILIYGGEPSVTNSTFDDVNPFVLIDNVDMDWLSHVSGNVYADDAASASAPASSKTADEALERWVAEEWTYQMEQNPVWASLLGDRRFNDRWDDMSVLARHKDLLHNKEALKQLEQIGRENLRQIPRLATLAVHFRKRRKLCVRRITETHPQDEQLDSKDSGNSQFQ